MTKKSSFERVHESSVALMREKAHTSGTTTQRSCDRKADRPCAHNNRVYTIHLATRFSLLMDVF